MLKNINAVVVQAKCKPEASEMQALSYCVCAFFLLKSSIIKEVFFVYIKQAERLLTAG